jgi:hypothetical protein
MSFIPGLQPKLPVARTRRITIVAAVSLLASTAGALADPISSPGLATYSLDANNGTDYPQSGVLDPSNLPSSATTSKSCTGSPTYSCVVSQVYAGPLGAATHAGAIFGQPGTPAASASAQLVYYFEIESNSSGPLPSSLLLDISPDLTTMASINSYGGSSAEAQLTIDALGFGITLKANCSVVQNNASQFECDEANNFGVTHDGVDLYNNGTDTFTPAPSSVVSSNSSFFNARVSFSNTEQITLPSSLYNTPIEILLSATGNGLSDFTAISDPTIAFDPSDIGLQNFALLQSPNLPAPVPEPATLALFGAGLLGMGFMYRRRNIKRA